MARRVALAIVLLLIVLVGGCASNNQEDPLTQDAANVQGGEPVPYTVTFQGADPDVETKLQEVSESVAGMETPPPSFLALRRRAIADEDRLQRALGGEGYYDARVTAEVNGPGAEDEPATIVFTVDQGTRYEFGAVTIDVLGEAPSYEPPTLADLGIEIGAPAVAQVVLDAESQLLEKARDRSYAYAKAEDRTAIIDKEAKTLDVTMRIQPGPPIKLGAVTFKGIDGIDEALVQGRVDWKDGQPYSPEEFTDTRRELVELGLFRAVEIDLPEEPPADGVAPVTITTEQRLHRTISAGVRFQTDAGPGGDVSWEHRNVFGAGERFRARLNADRLLQSADVSLRKPDVWGPDVAFLSEAAAIREDTDAFDSLTGTASVGLERRFSDILDGSLGVGFDYSDVTDSTGNNTFGLVFLPGTLRFDNTDEPLDATRGVRARLNAAPFWDILNTDLSFQRARIDGSTYFKLANSPRVVAAFRGAIGSIVGAARDSIPANRRFYAGGGGSVRGIGFQLASPLDENNDPVGGRSLLELSGELRYNVTESIGVVGFVDAGRAFEPSFPEGIDELIVGTGLGLRYFTPIGPLRFDVAVPVDRRPVDDAFQVYISLGQAF